ncbi:DoxX family protein [Naumannella sp. ID2617S]|uniref:DoxX family protein n=1 Tax=Enemella dayhoffiae TaxID=2016507 RepID=A0A255GT57_9ACTN|nr:DoxX family protein [Enemella dayhoffiae]NNG20679.1 DoxX family protein [Naumannella sp. ID2617S]OYO18652.1 DoxX family protein [Enemella dayhoffiae]
MSRLSAAGTAGLILRGAIGGIMIAHGRNHAKTLDGTAGWFKSIGFREERLHARLSALSEIGAGAALIAGAGTPLAAAGVIGTMAVAIRTVHVKNGFFITKEGWEYTGSLIAAAAALAATGPGPVSVDRALGLDKVGSPIGRALLATVLGGAAAAGLLSVYWSEPTPQVEDDQA